VIELTPLEKDELLSLPVVFGESPRSETDSITLPTRSLEVQVEAHTQSPTLGTVQVPVAAATGLATFTNRGQDEVSLPEGTGLRTLGTGAQRFETAELALIPAGIGSEVTVPIRAIVGGPAGNVAAGAIGAIEGPLGLSLTVTNGDRLSGGRSESRRGVSAADVQLARAALERQLLQSANAALQELLNEDEALVPQSIRLTDVLQREFSPDPGDASEIIQGTMVARVSAEVYDVASLQSEAAAALARGLGGERELVPGSLRVDLAAERAAHQARVGARSRASVDFGSLSALVAGRSQAEAADLLAAALDLAAPPRFRLWPEWWPRLPLLPLRVQPVWVEPTE
jgi:hypothetical protein